MRDILGAFPIFSAARRAQPAVLMGLILLLTAFALGGASREHALRLAIVELAALPLLASALVHSFGTDVWTRHRWALSLLAGLAALPLIQLIPLPPSIWTALPGREQAVLALQASGMTPGWSPISLTPDFTWQAWLALIPPAAVFLGLMMYGLSLARPLVWLALAVGILSVMLGAIQLGSATNDFYFWRTTDIGNVVGAFANRNHFVTLCLASLPFAVAMAMRTSSRREQPQTRFWWGLVYIVVMMLGVGASRSRFGVIFLAPVVVATLAAAWVGLRRGGFMPMLLGIAAATVGTAALIGTVALRPILSRFNNPSASEARFENWPIVIDAAEIYQPIGSGIGSFDRVYRAVEPLTNINPKFFNHAHNEYLEIWLETGIVGLALLVAFLAWFARRAWSAWTCSDPAANDLQRAASVSIVVMIVHSAVDYPLRTAALATFFALCCGILEYAGAKSVDGGDPAPTRRRRRVRRSIEKTDRAWPTSGR